MSGQWIDDGRQEPQRVYDGDQVDAYVHQLHAQLAELTATVSELREPGTSRSPALGHLEVAERVLGGALAQTEQMANKAVAQAERLRDRLLETANVERDGILASAAQERSRIAEAAELERRQVIGSAEQEARAIIESARAEAREILDSARAEARDLVAGAREEIEATARRRDEELAQQVEASHQRILAIFESLSAERAPVASRLDRVGPTTNADRSAPGPHDHAPALPMTASNGQPEEVPTARGAFRQESDDRPARIPATVTSPYSTANAQVTPDVVTSGVINGTFTQLDDDSHLLEVLRRALDEGPDRMFAPDPGGPDPHGRSGEGGPTTAAARNPSFAQAPETRASDGLTDLQQTGAPGPFPGMAEAGDAGSSTPVGFDWAPPAPGTAVDLTSPYPTPAPGGQDAPPAPVHRPPSAPGPWTADGVPGPSAVAKDALVPTPTQSSSLWRRLRSSPPS